MEPMERARALGLLSSTDLHEPGTIKIIESPDDQILTQLYRDAQFFVFPSTYEGFGLPLLEAMHAGIAVTASDSPAILEVTGNASLTFNPNNQSDIAAALIRISQEETLRTALSRRGYEQARLFSWQRAARQTLEVYRMVLER